MKYVKKPLPVDAWQIDVLELENQGAYPDWVYDALKNKNIEFVRNTVSPCVRIVTLEGTMTAYDGDYLLKGPKGEFWFNKKTIFEEMYEEYAESPVLKSTSPSIQVIDIVDQPDGSAIITFDMDRDTADFFTKEGLRRVLVDAANEVIKNHEN